MASPVPHSLKRGRSEGVRLTATFAALLVLAAASWALSHVQLGRAAAPLAMAIAGVKALLVALVFMELSRAGVVIRFIAVLVLAFIGLLCGFVFTDVALR